MKRTPRSARRRASRQLAANEPSAALTPYKSSTLCGSLERSFNAGTLVYNRRRSVSNDWVIVYVRENNLPYLRFGMSVSHSHRRTHRRWNPNVQTVRAIVAPGTRKRITVCTSCLKAGKVTRG